MRSRRKPADANALADKPESIQSVEVCEHLSPLPFCQVPQRQAHERALAIMAHYMML